MDSRTIRKTFIEYFAEHGHLNVPSSSLIPHNDPTVLLTTAGMQQMTPYFLGLETPPSLRMTSAQKCFRAVGKVDDVMEVGDATHHTFFEMLGNFSVGDYFKGGAIDLAWGLVTGPFGIDPGAVWITVNPEDDYSRDYWRDKIGIPARKIQDDPGNVWGPVGDTGPCGPNSEIYFDFDYSELGDTGRGPMSEDEDRYVEFWNLVFMEFYQEADASRRALASQNVDTGMGLERIAAVLQGKHSVYDTDLFVPIIERASELAGVRYGDSEQVDLALRIIADHGRAVTFLIADGVLPGNEGRGYVLRRIVRRAVQKARSIGLDGSFLPEIADVVIEHYSEQYPELRNRRNDIRRVLRNEEEAFGRTIATGITRFEALLESLRGSGVSVIPGDEAFRLHDTYGFPIDLTQELAESADFEVDMEGFRAALAEQRERSRAELDAFADESRSRAPLYAAISGEHSKFLGYEQTDAEASIVAILGSESSRDSADVGSAVEIVLAATPFYGESGGQVGDTGWITTATGRFEVEATQRPTPELIVHRGHVVEGSLEVAQGAHAEVDRERRTAIQRNHTATHLIHKALRQVLGEGTQQAGSLVAPDRLRFDFTTNRALGPDGLQQVAAIANAEVIADDPVVIEHESYDDAVGRGAMALFGEKYGDVVRVVEVLGYSVELCGGTHVGRTGEIGPVVITSESSIGTGTRRIEALTGGAALDYLAGLHRQATSLGQQLRVPPGDLEGAVGDLQDSLRERDRTISELRLQLASSGVDGLVEGAIQVDGTAVLATRVDAPDRETMLRVGDRLRDLIQSGVIVLASEIDSQPALVAMVTKDQTGKGLHAGRIIQQIAPIVGGRGGGRPELAQGGGSDLTRLDEALAAVETVVRDQVAG